MRAQEKLAQFLATHPVFRTEELLHLFDDGTTSAQVRRNLLHYHVRAGHVVPVRYGLYASVRPEQDPTKVPVDGFLVAARCTDDAVLAYHTALDVQGYAHSVAQRQTFLTAHELRPF